MCTECCHAKEYIVEIKLLNGDIYHVCRGCGMGLSDKNASTSAVTAHDNLIKHLRYIYESDDLPHSGEAGAALNLIDDNIKNIYTRFAGELGDYYK